jgi:hypothetical protein
MIAFNLPQFSKAEEFATGGSDRNTVTNASPVQPENDKLPTVVTLFPKVTSFTDVPKVERKVFVL